MPQIISLAFFIFRIIFTKFWVSAMCRPNFHPEYEKQNASVTYVFIKSVIEKYHGRSSYPALPDNLCVKSSIFERDVGPEESPQILTQYVETSTVGSDFSTNVLEVQSSVKVFASSETIPMVPGDPTIPEDPTVNFVVVWVGRGKVFSEEYYESAQENITKQRHFLLETRAHIKGVEEKLDRFLQGSHSLYSSRGFAEHLFVGICIISALMSLASAGSLSSCPTGCECSGSRMRCPSWAHAQPPEADRATYQELDLSPDGGCTNSSLVPPEHRCPVAGKQQRIRRSLLFPCDAPPGSLGSALDHGFLPENWLGDNFGYLTSLSLRGVDICSMHKNALRPQARLTTLDLSSNGLKRLNVFVIRKNLKLVNISLADNPKLELPHDGTVLYSDSIKFLDLSGCGICDLPEKIFRGMPKLESVKLNGNCLHELSTAPLTPSLAPSLARLDLSANLVRGMATAGEDATALARMSTIELGDNRWAPGCDAVRSSGDQVTLVGGNVTTWEVMVKQCVILVTTPEPSTLSILITSSHIEIREDISSEAKSFEKYRRDQRNIQHFERSLTASITEEDDWKDTASRWLIIVTICMNIVMMILMIILLIKHRRSRNSPPGPRIMRLTELESLEEEENQPKQETDNIESPIPAPGSTSTEVKPLEREEEQKRQQERAMDNMPIRPAMPGSVTTQVTSLPWREEQRWQPGRPTADTPMRPLMPSPASTQAPPSTWRGEQNRETLGPMGIPQSIRSTLNVDYTRFTKI